MASGDIRDRLFAAYRQFAPLQEEDLPRHMRATFRKIRLELTKEQPVGLEGTLVATRRAMQIPRARQLARRLWNLEQRLRVYADHAREQHRDL